nr:ArsC family reductase [Asaia bogorensis]
MEQRVTIYGITTCDTVRKARRWLDAEGVAYRYHDLRKDGLSAEELASWVGAVGWEKLLNKSGMTFRKLPEADKQISTEALAMALMLAHPTVIKRPVLVRDGAVTLGFKLELYAAVFAPTP